MQKIAELGVGNGQRALRMIEAAKRTSAPTDVHYVGLDLFEGRADSSGPAVSLKAAYQLLRTTDVRIQLIPGNPSESLMRVANSLGKLDLLIVPGEYDAAEHARLWFFVPRLLHERSLVFVDSALPDGQRFLRLKSRPEIDRLAAAGFHRHAA
jgi:hypothetical protein